MKFRILLALIAVIFLGLIAGGIYSAVTKESIEQKMCDNQKFTLTKLDFLAVTAKSLVGSSDDNRPPDQVAVYLKGLQLMHDEIVARRTELDKEYC